MRVFWAVAIGAALGGVARHYLGTYVQERPSPFGAFPIATLLINVTGSLLMGVVLQLTLSGGVSNTTRAFLATGFCGGYTTFSTFSWETLLLLQTGQMARAATYAVVSVLLSLGATFTGASLASKIEHKPMVASAE